MGPRQFGFVIFEREFYCNTTTASISGNKISAEFDTALLDFVVAALLPTPPFVVVVDPAPPDFVVVVGLFPPPLCVVTVVTVVSPTPPPVVCGRKQFSSDPTNNPGRSNKIQPTDGTQLAYIPLSSLRPQLQSWGIGRRQRFDRLADSINRSVRKAIKQGSFLTPPLSMQATHHEQSSIDALALHVAQSYDMQTSFATETSANNARHKIILQSLLYSNQSNRADS